MIFIKREANKYEKMIEENDSALPKNKDGKSNEVEDYLI